MRQALGRAAAKRCARRRRHIGFPLTPVGRFRGTYDKASSLGTMRFGSRRISRMAGGCGYAHPPPIRYGPPGYLVRESSMPMVHMRSMAPASHALRSPIA